MAFEIRANAAQDWLAAELSAALERILVPVSLGYPIGGPDAEHVWVVGDLDAAFSRRTSGGGMRDESGTLTVKILVTRRCEEFATVRDRAGEILDVIEAAISSDPLMGGAVYNAELVAAKGSEGVTKDGERQFGLDLSITYYANTTRS
jgi:hypothetical protein